MKRIISILLCVALLLGAFPVALAAAEDSARSEVPSKVTGANGVGTLLAKSLEESGEAEESATGLQDITIEDGEATVLFSTVEDAELVVAIYEETSYRMVTSGKVSVHTDDTKATIALDAASIPAYFRAEAFLLSSADYTPLCSSLSTPMYTREFQELLSKSTEDFADDRVLNLDEDLDTNFAVYGENVKRSQSDETSNTVVSADATALRYVIENPDSTVTSLQSGDFWSCESGEDILIVKVSSVTIKGNQAIIVGQETSMEEVFDYAKIEGEATAEDAVIDPSQTADGVTYNGITDMDAVPAKRAWSGEDSLKWGWSFSINKKIEVDEYTAKLSLSLDLSVTSKLNYYLAKSDSYISFTQEYKMAVKGSLENKLKLCEIPLTVIPIVIPICGVVNIEIEPNIVLEVSATVSVETSMVWSTGLTYEQGKGFSNTSTKPTPEAEFSVEGKLFLGVSVKVKFCIISSYIFDIAVSFEAGVEVTAKLTGRERENGKLHYCDGCFDGKIQIVFKLKASIELLKFIKAEATLAEYKHLLGTFYNSVTYREGGWGKCPYWFAEGNEPTEPTSPTEPTEDPNDYDYSGTCGSNVKWGLNKATGVLKITGTGKMDNWDSYNSSPWDSYRGSIKSVEIRSGVTSIGDRAFLHCSRLTSVTIGNSVTSIGGSAFAGCSRLTSVTIGNSVTSIGHDAFWNCSSLTSVTIPDSVTSIGVDAFYFCSSLTSVTIGNSVTSIGDYAFYYCSSLTSVTIPDSVTSIGNCAFYYCSSLTSVTIPDSVTSIGAYAFDICSSLTSVTIPGSVTSIGGSAFYYCSRLTKIYFCGNAPSIRSDAFGGVTATAYYPSGNSTWTDGAKQNYGGEITWTPWTPTRNVKASDAAPDAATEPVSELRSLHIGTQDGSTVRFSGLTAGSSYVLVASKDEEDLLAADNLLYIAQAPANEDGTLEFIIGLRESCVNPFVGLYGDGCTCYTGVCGEDLTWTFDIKTRELTISGIGAMTEWDTDSNVAPWREYSSLIKTITLPDGITSIGNRAFSNCSNLLSVTIPDSVTNIGSGAFFGCVSLESIVFPNSITNIGNGAFFGCIELKSVLLSENLTCINNLTFYGCKALTDITIPDGVTSIGDSAFIACTSMTSITIPESLSTIGSSAFSFCNSLQDVYFGGTEEAWNGITIGSNNEDITAATIHYNSATHTHDYTTAVTKPTCTEGGYTTYTCACGDSYKDTVTAPTCTAQGYTTHTCSVCGDSYKDTYTDALGHNWNNGVITTQPTEAKEGVKTFTCSRCGETRTESVPVLAHTHSYTAVVTKPTCMKKGYTTYTCACGDSYVADYVGALGHDFVDGTCSRCGADDPNFKPIDPDKPCDGGKDCPSYGFTDVNMGDWYHAAVDFAVEHGLFKGMTATTFEPNTPMTRAMLVTVLWRYENSPKEGTNIFTDVKNGEWYAEAVAWAAENGIVTGVGNGRFDPNGKITREQLAAILYRYSGNKGYDTSKRGDFAPFPDKDKVSSWAADAYGWAVGEKLINGNNINGVSCLDPQGNATRAQVATILMRFIQQIAK